MRNELIQETEKIKFLGIPVGRRVYLPESIKTYLFGIRMGKRKYDVRPSSKATGKIIKKGQNISATSLDIDTKTIDRVIKINYSISKLLYYTNRISLSKNEKIRIHFLYIADSYWPSWESLYQTCMNDPKIDVKLIFMNTAGTKLFSSQYEHAEQFLKDNNIPYVDYADYYPDEEKPHVMIYQTPYDTNYGVFKKLRPDFITELGIRIVYMSYGIEYDRSRTNKRLQDLQHNHLVHKLAWKIFVMHKDIKDGFYKYCRTGGFHVVVSGHPKFDCYINKKFELQQEIKDKAAGRPIIMIQLHCYNDNDCTGQKRIHTISFIEHQKILKVLQAYKNYFFIYTIHPAYKTRNIERKHCSLQDYSKFISDIQHSENMYLYEGNHQTLLANADAFITENSSLMIEMAFFNKSVLYMYDVPVAMKPFAEKITDTFHHGSTYKDVINFMDEVVSGDDNLLHLREMYREDIFPAEVYDGKIGYKIKEYICAQLRKE